MSIRLLCLIIIIVITSQSAYSSELDDLLFKKGTELYGNKKYQEAAEVFEKIVDKGVNSPELFYNLGNCNYRLGKTAPTIYYYEKAAKLAPSDEDIAHNLMIANLRTIDKFDEVPAFFINAWINDIRDSRTSGEWSVLAIIFLWIAMALLAGFLMFYSVTIKKVLFASAILSMLLFMGSLSMSVMKSINDKKNITAIVFSASAYVKSSPDFDGTDLFILHEGSKIQILDEIKQGEKWSKIRLPNGKTGWMLSSEARTI
jgi:tetratricopeptide (TPR) repeat protein